MRLTEAHTLLLLLRYNVVGLLWTVLFQTVLDISLTASSLTYGAPNLGDRLVYPSTHRYVMTTTSLTKGLSQIYGSLRVRRWAKWGEDIWLTPSPTCESTPKYLFDFAS